MLLDIAVAIQVTKGSVPDGSRPNVDAGAITVGRNRCVVKRAWNRQAAGGGVGVPRDLDARDGKCGWGQSSRLGCSSDSDRVSAEAKKLLNLLNCNR